MGTKKRAFKAPPSPTKRKKPEEEDQDPETEEGKQAPETKEEEEIKSSNAFPFAIDPKVLHCFICRQPFLPPLFQCIKGHVACSRCCDGTRRRDCPSCSFSLGLVRCLALESILDAVRIPCPNSSSGCKETLPFTHHHIHAAACPHKPLPCPVPDCPFLGPGRRLSSHLRSDHRSLPQVSFSYGSSFRVALGREVEPFCVLHAAEDGRIFLLINGRDVPAGNSVSVGCVGSDPGEWEFECEIVVGGGKGKGSSLQLKGPPVYLRDRARAHGDGPVGEFFLFVSRGIGGMLDVINADVCIRREKKE